MLARFRFIPIISSEVDNHGRVPDPNFSCGANVHSKNPAHHYIIDMVTQWPNGVGWCNTSSSLSDGLSGHKVSLCQITTKLYIYIPELDLMIL
jgi:hypothetical protein